MNVGEKDTGPSPKNWMLQQGLWERLCFWGRRHGLSYVRELIFLC